MYYVSSIFLDEEIACRKQLNLPVGITTDAVQHHRHHHHIEYIFFDLKKKIECRMVASVRFRLI